MPHSRSEHVLEEALNLLSIALFIISSDHEVIWMNHRGKSLIDSRNGISLINNRLRGETTTQTREIDAVLERTTARDRKSVV